MKQVYETEDGQFFDSAVDALEHEQCTFEDWLDTTREGQFCDWIMRKLDSKHYEEFYGTSQDFALEFVKKAFYARNEAIDDGEENECCVRSEN